jgi:polyferredoxin
VIIVGTLWSMVNRVPLRADLIRDRNALYRELPGDLIENVYTLKITNMDNAPHSYRLTAIDNEQVEIDLDRPLELTAEEVAGVIVRLRIPRSAGKGVQDVELELQAVDNPEIRREITAKAMLPIGIGGR